MSDKNSSSQQKFLNGRLNQPISDLAITFNASVSFDKKLALYDIQGSIAHVTMLAEQKIIDNSEKNSIINGLIGIAQHIKDDKFNWQIDLEDVHMNIESALIEKIGEAGKKLHTARSRNDQIATDIRLYARDHNKQLQLYLKNCQRVLLSLAKQYYNTIMPGFTHLQIAQPVTFGHHLLAWFHMFERDRQRLIDCYKRINRSPLGSAALAGTTYPINPLRTAELLEFDGICGNSMDAVSDRDFVIEMLNALSLIMMHLSRICEEMILWNSTPYDLIELPDDYCTGSSIMPQKKNPDILELIRGKFARVFASANSLSVLMKSQPLTYNKDNQEDKEPFFDAIETAMDSLQLFTDLLKKVKAKPENMRKLTEKGFSNATDLADYLVKKGLPFRDAYKVVGEVVRLAIKKEVGLSQLKLTDLQKIHNHIEGDVYDYMTLEAVVNARNHPGGTAPNEVLKTIQVLEKLLAD